MTLQQLRDLVAVVQYGGFRAAARALDVSQAGLTKNIARLEDEHGISLIDRSAKGVVLSTRGQDFLPYAQAVLQDADRAEEWLRNVRGGRQASVTLGVSIEPSLHLAPAVLADFRRALPEVTIRVTQSSSFELLAAIRDNRLDLAVIRLPAVLDSNDLHIDVLYESRAAIMARRNHPLRDAESVRDLEQLEWVVVGDPGRSGLEDDSIRELFTEQHLSRPRVAAVSDSLFGTISMLLESDCVARLPATVLDHPLVAQSLTEIRVREQQSRPFNVGIVFKASRRLSAEAKLLVGMLKSFSRLKERLASAKQADTGRRQ